MSLTLYGHDPSPFVRRVRILYTELGVPFARDTHGWMDATAEFLAASPIQRVPMLDRGPGARTRYVFDSRVLAEVGYEIAPSERPLGTPPLQRTLWNPALAEEDKNVASTIDAALEAGINLFLIERDGIRRAQSAYLQRQAARIESCLEWLDGRYAGVRTLTDGALAWVDIAAVCLVGWMRFRAIADVDARKNLVALEEAHADRPSFASTRPA